MTYVSFRQKSSQLRMRESKWSAVCCAVHFQVMSRFKLPPLLDIEGPDFKQIQTALMGMGEPSE